MNIRNNDTESKLKLLLILNTKFWNKVEILQEKRIEI